MGGAKDLKDEPMSLSYRLGSKRERLIGMTDEERAWRAKFLKSQELCPDEPRITKEYIRKRYNPIRRIYRFPMDQVEKFLTPAVGAENAFGIRHITAKTCMAMVFTWCAWYYFKYNAHDWTKFGGWRVNSSRKIEYPSDPGFPTVGKKIKGNEFAVYDFDKSPI